jgi:predicted Rossmann-fold nucleotide-binding protein
MRDLDAGRETPGRRTIVGVMGSGTVPHGALAVPLGRLLAASGFHLLTGAGDGVMAEVSRAFCHTPGRRGLSIGILPSEEEPSPDPVTGLRRFRPRRMNPWVEIPIITHLPLSGDRGTDVMSRNHINVLTADVLIALPGSAGTLSEVRLRVQYGRPVILFLGRETIDGYDEARIREETHLPERILAAHTIEDVPVRIRQSLEIQPFLH